MVFFSPSELWVSLEEHQDALELIMSKYRKHMLQLMVKRKDLDAQPVLNVHQTQSTVSYYFHYLFSVVCGELTIVMTITGAAWVLCSVPIMFFLPLCLFFKTFFF